jgi:hypothetical protein
MTSLPFPTFVPPPSVIEVSPAGDWSWVVVGQETFCSCEATVYGDVLRVRSKHHSFAVPAREAQYYRRRAIAIPQHVRVLN